MRKDWPVKGTRRNRATLQLTQISDQALMQRAAAQTLGWLINPVWAADG